MNEEYKQSNTDEIIKFRNLYSSLTDEEVKKFHSMMIDNFGRNIFIMAFCNQMLPPNYNNKSDVQKKLVSATHLLNDIIKSRNQFLNHEIINQTINLSSTKPIITNTDPSLDTLPCELIGEIASWLSQRDYIFLSFANRTVYIACNYPITRLTRLNACNYWKSSKYINISRYSQINTLGLSCIKIGAYHTQNKPFKNVTRLFLYGPPQHYVTNEQEFIDEILMKKESNRIIDPLNIRQLSLNKFDDITLNRFIEILKKCPNIEYLWIHETKIWVPEVINPLINIKQIIPNLKGFGMFSKSGKLTNILINNFGSSLKVWHNVRDIEINIPKETLFHELHEVYLSKIEPILLKKIINQSSAIKSITLQRNMKSLWLSDNEISLLQLILMKQRQLQSLTIIENKYNQFDDICDAVESALFQVNIMQSQNQDSHCHNLRIALLFWVPSYKQQQASQSKPKFPTVILKFTRIIEKLQDISFIKDWVLKIQIYGQFNGNLNDQSKSLNAIMTRKNIKIRLSAVKLTSDLCQDIVLTAYNKNSSMNGWLSGYSNKMDF